MNKLTDLWHNVCEQLLALGMDVYISKPVRADELEIYLNFMVNQEQDSYPSNYQ